MINPRALYRAVSSRVREYINVKKSRNVTIEIAELFFQHNGESDFLRYDMIVRLLAVENYFGKNDYGFDFYRRMQRARMSEKWVSPAVERFKELIKSYEEIGYDENSRITLDKNLHLYDGSHRMAMAMYYNIPKVNAIVRPDEYNVFYGIEWFYINGFSKEECNILQAKYHELKARYNTSFVCSIWSPAQQYFDEITDKLKLFGTVSEVKDYELNEWDYKFYTRGIYHVDDIEKWKIEKKIDYMIKASPKGFKIRMVTLTLNQPDFRLKEKTGTTLSKQCELIKKLIRDAYKGKISNYFHDIILHIGDNFYQNRHIYRLLTMPNIDLVSILEHIKDRQYVVTKFEVPYMTHDFPYHYPLGKDMDIVCANLEEFEIIRESLLSDLRKYEDYYNLRIVEKTDEEGVKYRTLIRLEQAENYLVYQLDVSSRYLKSEFKDNIAKAMVSSREEKHGIFVPQVKYELLLRMKELHDNPNKQHHLEYIKKHIEYFDDILADKYLPYNWQEQKNKIV